MLEEKGYEALNLDGGYKTYSGVYLTRGKVDNSFEKIDDTGKIEAVKSN